LPRNTSTPHPQTPRPRKLNYDAVLDSIRDYAVHIGRKEEVLAVILFGSLATGNYTGTSDADIMILVSYSASPFTRRADTFIDPYLPVPMDVFVYTLNEAFINGSPALPMVKRALQHGIYLYLKPGFEIDDPTPFSEQHTSGERSCIHF